jgi:hypothetical protein
MLGTGKEKVQRFKGSNAPDGAGSNKVQTRLTALVQLRVLGDRERNVNQVAFESGLIWKSWGQRKWGVGGVGDREGKQEGQDV